MRFKENRRCVDICVLAGGRNTCKALRISINKFLYLSGLSRCFTLAAALGRCIFVTRVGGLSTK